MKNWGFKIPDSRTLDLDKEDLKLYNKIVEKVPSARRCIMCGMCSATCSAANHTNFNFRLVHHKFRMGMFESLASELDKCMLCGKCRMLCPRGVNTRAVIYNMRIILDNMYYKNI
ncbi:MAG: 4Fe-4S dicluster domain-containing protein [Bacteroidales bacterium]|jgi:heterodisulfide reductase subunit C|nr:4Fe-4S dicluster domain-containing protein [Bacteroidales bacterium]HOL99111.1 4Fe-4S dicluster domain-containing protein [Bacteroidales bacterium]HOM37502.1 4Fe-4S dicluster domain-containing protein [Bacteroidales bacterium]HPD24968.1 4Fe-4S dicluster domain-containing protein [Bacteroidales bacterium]HRT00691.1 4Fe-4S dicluster domain-containing protein [Bacteroidales bacterium]